MYKARAGNPAPDKDKGNIPEWLQLVKEYVTLKRKENNVNNNGHIHLSVQSGLYRVLFQRLKELEKNSDPKSGIIRFPIVFEKICRNFSINKQQAWELLFLCSDLGFLEIVPYQGIRLRNKTVGQIFF